MPSLLAASCYAVSSGRCFRRLSGVRVTTAGPETHVTVQVRDDAELFVIVDRLRDSVPA